MSIWVVTADASRARFFEAQAGGGPLQELQDLVHPGSRLHEHDLVSDSPGAGRGRSQGGGVGLSLANWMIGQGSMAPDGATWWLIPVAIGHSASPRWS